METVREWCVLAMAPDGALAFEKFTRWNMARRRFLELVAQHGKNGNVVRMMRTVERWEA